MRILQKSGNFVCFPSCRRCSRSRIPRCRCRWKFRELGHCRCGLRDDEREDSVEWVVVDFADFVDLVLDLVIVASSCSFRL